MSVKHVLKLTEEEREELSRIARGSRGRGVIAGWKVTRARALLKCDQGPWGPAWPDHRMAEALEVTERSLQSWRKRAVLEGPAAALSRRLRVPVPRKVDGRLEAQMTRLAYSTPLEGRSRWTLRLLAEAVRTCSMRLGPFCGPPRSACKAAHLVQDAVVDWLMSHAGEHAADAPIARPWVLVLTRPERSPTVGRFRPRWLRWHADERKGIPVFEDVV